MAFGKGLRKRVLGWNVDKESSAVKDVLPSYSSAFLDTRILQEEGRIFYDRANLRKFKEILTQSQKKGKIYIKRTALNGYRITEPVSSSVLNQQAIFVRFEGPVTIEVSGTQFS